MAVSVSPPLSVVVVERDRAFAQRLAGALTRAGYAPGVATTTRGARRLLRRHRPVLVYTSERVDEEGGGDLLAELEREDAHAAALTLFRAERADSVIALALRRSGRAVICTDDVDAIVRRIIDVTLHVRAQQRPEEWREVLARSRRLILEARAHQRRARALLAEAGRMLSAPR